MAHGIDRKARLRGALALGTAWLSTVAATGVALAQEAAQDAATERATSFRAVEGAVQEDVPGGPLLVAAYAVIWVFVMLYVVRVVRHQQQSQRDLSRLEAQLEKAAKRAEA
jgi:CcmD family protein